MLPLKSTRFEVNRDYSLEFESITLSDLGTYICQAYSGYGKPVSMYITLNAVGPAYPTTPEEAEYLRYVIEAPKPIYPNEPISYIPTPAVDLTPHGKLLRRSKHFSASELACMRLISYTFVNGLYGIWA